MSDTRVLRSRVLARRAPGQGAERLQGALSARIRVETSERTSSLFAARHDVAVAHVPALDGVRGIALVLVVLFHAKVPGFANGDIGVDVFFVLSGFLITGILMRSDARGGIRFGTFYRRRALRLLPAYLVVLTVCVACDFVFDTGGTLKGAVASFFYVSNWAVAAGLGLGLLAHTWSLAIEEQFYLLWPVTLAFLLRRFRSRLDRLAIVVASAVVASYLSIVGLRVAGASVGLAWNATTSRGMELLAGCLLAVVVRRRSVRATQDREPRPAPHPHVWGALGLLAAAGLFIVAIHDPSDPWVEILLEWPLVVVLTTTAILACLSGRNVAGIVLSSRPLAMIGKTSYGAYLWHFPVLVVIDAAVGLETWGPRLLGLGITAVIVPLSYRFVERPFLRLKDGVTQPGRLLPSRVVGLVSRGGR